MVASIRAHYEPRKGGAGGEAGRCRSTSHALNNRERLACDSRRSQLEAIEDEDLSADRWNRAMIMSLDRSTRHVRFQSVYETREALLLYPRHSREPLLRSIAGIGILIQRRTAVRGMWAGSEPIWRMNLATLQKVWTIDPRPVTTAFLNPRGAAVRTVVI